MLALIGPTIPELSPPPSQHLPTWGYRKPTSSSLADGPKRRDEPSQRPFRALGSSTPIDSIPTELLVHIFLLVRDASRNLSWLKLSHVSRYWRDLALATPLLWTSIPVEKGPSFVSACLERSGDVLVDIVSRRFVLTADPLLDVLRQHAYRCRTLQFPAFSNEAAEQLLADVVAPANSLKHLVLQVQTPSNNYALPPLALPNRDWAALCGLQLKGIALPRRVSPMPNLTSLKLSDIVAGHRWALEALLDSIAECPHLVHLSISDSCPSPVMEDDSILRSAGKGRPPIPLRALQTLQLSMHASAASELLASVSLPQNATADVKCVIDPRQISQNLISYILGHHALAAGSKSAAHVRSLYLFVASNIFRIRAFGANGSSSIKLLDVDVECNPPMDMSYLLPDALRDLAHVFVASPVTDLQVFGDQRLISQQAWRAALSQLPALETLEVGSRGQVDALFQALSYPDVASPLCARLKKLCVGGADAGEELADVMLTFLESRAAHSMRLDVLALKRRAIQAPFSPCTIQAILDAVGMFDYR